MRAAPQSVRAVEQAHATRRKQSHDALEQEADEVADTLVRRPFPDRIPHISPSSGSGESIAGRPPSVGQVLAQSGEPLTGAERSYFEPRFGRDLSGIRLHRGSAAARSAAVLNAQAYAYENHIVLGSDAMRLSEPAGRQLLAHEISHTLQQRNGVASVQRKPRQGADEEDRGKPGVASVTAEQGARTANIVLSDGSSASVELLINKLPPGDYVTSPVGRVRNPTAEGIPGKFVYRYPVDPYTEEPINGLTSRTEIHIRPAPTAEVRQLPTEIRDFVTSDRARPGTADEYRDAAYAGQILKEAGVTADELILVQESRRHEREIAIASGEFGTQTDWAFDYVQKRQEKQLDKASNWDALVELSKIMAEAPTHLLHRGGAGSILEEGSEPLARVTYLNLIKFKKITPTGKQEFYSTGARLLAEFRALIGHFETALVEDLTSLAVAALDSAEASLLRMDRQYVGMWQDKKWPATYFWNEVQRINRNEKVVASARERDQVKQALERVEREREDKIRAINLIDVLRHFVFDKPTHSQPKPTYAQRIDQLKKEIERQNQAFNQTVAEQSGLKVTQGFSAEDILAAKTPSDAQGRLSDFLFNGRQQITRARNQLGDRKVIYAADKIIALEKDRLKDALGAKSSEVGRVIDDLARYRKSQTSIWDDILKVVEFVSMFVPGPIGWGLRIGVAAVKLDKRFTGIGMRRDLFGGNLSAKSVGPDEVGDALFEAAIEVVPDVPAAKTKRLTPNLERAAARSADDVPGVASRTASTAEHGAPQGLAGDVAGRARVPDPPSGSGALASAPKPDLGMPTSSNLSDPIPKGGGRAQFIGQEANHVTGVSMSARRTVSSNLVRTVPEEVNSTLKTLGVTEYDIGQFALGQKVFGQIKRGGIEFTPYFIRERDKLVAGVLSAASRGDTSSMIKAFLIFRKSAMDMAKRLGAKTLRLEADVVTEDLIGSLERRRFKLVSAHESKFALEISLR